MDGGQSCDLTCPWCGTVKANKVVILRVHERKAQQWLWRHTEPAIYGAPASLHTQHSNGKSMGYNQHYMGGEAKFFNGNLPSETPNEMINRGHQIPMSSFSLIYEEQIYGGKTDQNRSRCVFIPHRFPMDPTRVST